MYDNSYKICADKKHCKKNNSEEKRTENKKDIFYDTPLRYIGYSDDIGVAARVICKDSKNVLIKNLPKLSFIPVSAYVTADVVSTYNKSKEEDGKKIAFKKAASKAIYHGITDIIAPILIIGGAQKMLGKGFDKFIPQLRQNLPAGKEKIINRKRDITLALGGLAALLALSKPVDNFSNNVLMKKIINPVLGMDDKTSADKSHRVKNKLNTTQA